jgi:hypothetical protein
MEILTLDSIAPKATQPTEVNHASEPPLVPPTQNLTQRPRVRFRPGSIIWHPEKGVGNVHKTNWCNTSVAFAASEDAEFDTRELSIVVTLLDEIPATRSDFAEDAAYWDWKCSLQILTVPGLTAQHSSFCGRTSVTNAVKGSGERPEVPLSHCKHGVDRRSCGFCIAFRREILPAGKRALYWWEALLLVTNEKRRERLRAQNGKVEAKILRKDIFANPRSIRTIKDSAKNKTSDGYSKCSVKPLPSQYSNPVFNPFVQYAQPDPILSAKLSTWAAKEAEEFQSLSTRYAAWSERYKLYEETKVASKNRSESATIDDYQDFKSSCLRIESKILRSDNKHRNPNHVFINRSVSVSPHPFDNGPALWADRTFVWSAAEANLDAKQIATREAKQRDDREVRQEHIRALETGARAVVPESFFRTDYLSWWKKPDPYKYFLEILSHPLGAGVVCVHNWPSELLTHVCKECSGEIVYRRELGIRSHDLPPMSAYSPIYTMLQEWPETFVAACIHGRSNHELLPAKNRRWLHRPGRVSKWKAPGLKSSIPDALRGNKPMVFARFQTEQFDTNPFKSHMPDADELSTYEDWQKQMEQAEPSSPDIFESTETKAEQDVYHEKQKAELKHEETLIELGIDKDPYDEEMEQVAEAAGSINAFSEDTRLVVSDFIPHLEISNLVREARQRGEFFPNIFRGVRASDRLVLSVDPPNLYAKPESKCDHGMLHAVYCSICTPIKANYVFVVEEFLPEGRGGTSFRGVKSKALPGNYALISRSRHIQLEGFAGNPNYKDRLSIKKKTCAICGAGLASWRQHYCHDCAQREIWNVVGRKPSPEVHNTEGKNASFQESKARQSTARIPKVTMGDVLDYIEPHLLKFLIKYNEYLPFLDTGAVWPIVSKVYGSTEFKYVPTERESIPTGYLHNGGLYPFGDDYLTVFLKKNNRGGEECYRLLAQDGHELTRGELSSLSEVEPFTHFRRDEVQAGMLRLWLSEFKQTATLLRRMWFHTNRCLPGELAEAENIQPQSMRKYLKENAEAIRRWRDRLGSDGKEDLVLTPLE